MIGATASSPLLTSQMYQKMFAQVDANADGAVSLDELGTIKTKAPASGQTTPAIADVFAALDRNGDGGLQAGEFTPDKLFDNTTLGTMLSAQEYRDADPEAHAAANRAAVEALFERADIDGDGLLNQAEIDAEKALRRAETLDTGKLPEVMYLLHAGADGKLAPEDVAVGRLVPMSELKALEMPPELRESFERVKAIAAQASDGDAKPSRGLDDLRAQVQTELDTKPLSTEMISRLFARLSADAFGRELQAAPVDQSA
jgi:Ca2+-binding EF-hand superfamily protein